MNPETIKKHFAEHKEVYVGIGIGLTLAGITWVIVRGRNTSVHGALGSDLHGGSEGFGRSVVENTTRSLSFGFNNHTTSINNAVTTIHKGSRGPSGFVTRCVETGELFETQDAAARAFDISKSVLSSHLNKGTPLKEGLHFERLGIFQ